MTGMDYYNVVVKAKRRQVKIIGKRLCGAVAVAVARGFNQAEENDPKGLHAVVTRMSPNGSRRPKKMAERVRQSRR